MRRRIHITDLHPGEIRLSSAEAHHARDVLRLTEGTTVELFDDAGKIADGKILSINHDGMIIRVETIRDASGDESIELTIAAAIPKGERADWMIEKLSELGVHRFIPLITARGVVVPAGKNKMERWTRIAIESAKQSRRTGVMQIAEITPLAEALRATSARSYLSTAANATPIYQSLENRKEFKTLLLFVGPEGGWTNEEIAEFEAAECKSVALTRTILRVETAAIATAAVIGCWR